MNKKHFIERMVEHTDSPKGEAEKHLQAFETTITDALKAGEEVQLPGFGKFYVKAVVNEVGPPPRRLLSSIARESSECPTRPPQTREVAEVQYHCTPL
jgi:hypothetical protein